MARTKKLENMSVVELTQMQARIERMKVEKQNAERVELLQKLATMAKQHGFDIRELVGKSGKGKRSKVSIKYRDPKNPANTWTGRGRTPRWMTAAIKAGKARDDFLI